MSASLPVASQQDGTYPRPQLMRSAWCELDGEWDFAFGADQSAPPRSVVFDRSIVVPFPPESPGSGIGDTGFHPVVWYRRAITASELAAAGAGADGSRIILHFGAVDRSADVWLNGVMLGHHDGGQTPFWFDITDALGTDALGTDALGSDALAPDAPNELIVRAVDDPHDVSVPRGKQDWNEEPHSIWYHRTTGIWQPVWLEAVPAIRITEVHWQTDIPSASVDLELTLDRTPAPRTWAHVMLSRDGEVLSEARFHLSEGSSQLRLGLDGQRNGQHYEQLLWSPESPTLLDATIVLERDGQPTDAVSSYLGLRSVSTGPRRFLLNDRPTYLRSVLAQNYWPESHLAAPSAAALRREVELIKALGFNAARVHQKAEDPRFLYWADRLGLMIWAETASAYAFDPRAVAALTAEWIELVRRDRSHPSIVTWVPFNESWGIQHVAHDHRQRAFSRAIADITRAIDGTRPVISNDGWEHTSSDIWTIHDYEDDPAALARRLGTEDAITELLHGFGHAGRRISASQIDAGEPVMLTEFGGISFVDADVEGAWGYSSAHDADDFEAKVSGLIGAVRSSQVLAGFCYTQLTDTGQETNGLLYADRSPKVPIETLRRAVLGS
ncbi:glycoside hydrolase family 2 protein [Naasia lichenicola]|uniref:Glycoside hydrolase family 2 n=1 Tax=Naasia lichenicola TaxID=2565933 RepID=A0A4S4FGG7_9MICO|nr:glycoside hydrolase family 2 TIM barrel-domain containing protein [Naasia lichenicola]THG29350.1 glycoside hydrolase family 2 [Naasia lichenicola]